MYHFQEEWLIEASREVVWAPLARFELLDGLWTKGTFRAAALGAYHSPQVGNRYRVSVRSYLPYTLELTFELTGLTYPDHVAVDIQGDLVGRGATRLEDLGPRTRVLTEERVSFRKPGLRLLEPLVRPLLAFNHRWAMRQGQAALVAYLTRPRNAGADHPPTGEMSQRVLCPCHPLV